MSSNIEKARTDCGYSQEHIARVLGVSRPTYASIETGKKELTISQAKLLASLFSVSIENILGDDSISVLSGVAASTEKYEQIILNALKYGADSDGKITKTKLAKLVYLVDFIWYYQNLAPMSGMAYRKLKQGPVADIYFRILDELEESGSIVRENKGQAILFSIVEENAPKSKLSDSELLLIESICKAWKGASTSEIVEFTHQQLPWQICRDGEVIPYSLISQEEPERIYGPVKL